MSIAVIRFPGSNCEAESLEALRKFNISYQLIDWNESTSLDIYSGFILPGGFSYQDRLRAGVIGAKLPIISELKHQSKKNKPILGICNGAQILVESGLLGSEETLNQIIDFNYVDNRKIGFLSDWGFLSPFNPTENSFLKHFKSNDILPIQICHGEGRFLFDKPPTSGLKYTSIHGKETGIFPDTPNGSTENIAAFSNVKGNILAIMPHPERSLDAHRYPLSIQAYAKKNNLKLVDFSHLFQVFKESEL